MSEVFISWLERALSLIQRALSRLGMALWPHHTLKLEAGTRAAFIGRSGAGKTTFQRWLLGRVPSALVYDTKLDPKEWAQDLSYQQVGHPSRLADHARAVLQVSTDWLRDTAGWRDPQAGGYNWTRALEAPMRRGRTVVLFDEALLTLPHNAGHDAAHRLFQQGRSFGVTVLVGSQLANNLDTRVLRTAEHVFCWRTIHQTDLDEIMRARGVETATLQVLRPREIAYHHEAEHRWEVFKPVNLRHPGHLHRRVHVPPPSVAAAGARARAAWYLRRSLKRMILPGFFFVTPLPGLLLGTRQAIVMVAAGVYIVARRWRSDRWSVEVECTQHPVELPVEAPLALPAPAEPWRLRIPTRRSRAS